MGLTDGERDCVAAAIVEVASVREWTLLAPNVRTNHVHLVVSGKEEPEAMLVTFKAWATRHLRQVRFIGPTTKVWARHGSTKWVWTQTRLERVCHYVTELQDNRGGGEPGA